MRRVTLAALARRHPRRLLAAGVVLLLVALVAALGGFGRSERPVQTVAVGERIELGQFAFTVHGATVVDRDEDGEPFDEAPLRLLIDVTVVNTSDESGHITSDLIGIKKSGGDDYFTIDSSLNEMHPDLPQRFEVALQADEASLGAIPGDIDVWLGEQVYGWTNLLNSGPEWSVPHWAGIVADVPITDGRSGR